MHLSLKTHILVTELSNITTKSLVQRKYVYCPENEFFSTVFLRLKNLYIEKVISMENRLVIKAP